jgi:hypothetical protein
VRQHLRQRFPGLDSRNEIGVCGLEESPSAMQAAAAAATRQKPDWPRHAYDIIAGPPKVRPKLSVQIVGRRGFKV